MRAFRRATLPMLAPAITAGVLLRRALHALRLRRGGHHALRYLRALDPLQYRGSFDRSVASILALVLVVAALAVAMAEARLRRRAATNPPARAVAAPVRLGRWRWPALLLVGAVVALSLVLPAVTIAWWLVRGLLNAQPLRIVPEATFNSVVVGVAAAVTAVAVALPLAVLAARWRSRFAGAVERLSYAGYAIPGIALALAVVFFAANVVPWAYQTLGLFVLAYAIRFLPQAIAPSRQALASVGPRLEEAARSLGERPWGVFRTITLPLLRPGLAGGAALVFLTTVKELPMALLLAPIGFETLATTIWGAATEGLYARAAAPAAILMVVSAVTVAVLVRGEEAHA
jgi:iron(III) transport system permease protein